MREVWRLCKKKYAATAFDGEGSSKFGNRWNSKGVRMAYTSAHLSLATLEYYVHLKPEDVQLNLVSCQAIIPHDVPMKTLTVEQLPLNWNAVPAPKALAAFGDHWIAAAETVALALPSIIIPQDCNILLNPLHPDFAKLIFVPPEPFVLDERLLERMKPTSP